MEPRELLVQGGHDDVAGRSGRAVGGNRGGGGVGVGGRDVGDALLDALEDQGVEKSLGM